MPRVSGDDELPRKLSPEEFAQRAAANLNGKTNGVNGKANGHAAIVGVGHCSNCSPAVATHAITLETRYGVPTVGIHTDKFDRVVTSVTKMAGLPDARRAFVPMPVMGKTTEELKAHVYGKDPITGLPVMQEVIAGLTTALSN